MTTEPAMAALTKGVVVNRVGHVRLQRIETLGLLSLGELAARDRLIELSLLLSDDCVDHIIDRLTLAADDLCHGLARTERIVQLLFGHAERAGDDIVLV